LSVVWKARGGAYRVHECPPNGQGLVALLALNILSNFDIEALPPLSAERLHLEIEALRLAFADARAFIADPSFPALFAVDGGGLGAFLSTDYAKERSRLIDPGKASADPVAGTPLASSDTVYFSVVDAEGDACSFINSNYMGFGTGIVPKGRGFSLQNRGLNFSLERDHPNRLEPGKRPYHTIIPAMLTREGAGGGSELAAAFGVMGGFMQPQGHVQVALALMEGLDPQSSLDLSRFCIDIGGPGAAGPVLLEEGIDWRVAARLADLGHAVRPVAGWGRAGFGRGQVIALQENGVRVGGSDPRADGCALPQV
jgi:gamma-glutamyltranspeptidase/glutathione hydrolase